MKKTYFVELNDAILMCRLYTQDKEDRWESLRTHDLEMENETGEYNFFINKQRDWNNFVKLIKEESCVCDFECLMSSILKEIQSHDNNMRDFSQDVVDRLNAEQAEYMINRGRK